MICAVCGGNFAVLRIPLTALRHIPIVLGWAGILARVLSMYLNLRFWLFDLLKGPCCLLSTFINFFFYLAYFMHHLFLGKHFFGISHAGIQPHPHPRPYD